MIDFSRNHFELFGLPERFRFDPAVLDRAYHALQGDVHPDRHAAASEAAQRLALQSSARVNEAYRALQDPVERAQYLLSLHGIDAFSETDTSLPFDFLERQLERREAAGEAAAAGDAPALAALLAAVRAESAALEQHVAGLLDTDAIVGRRAGATCASSSSCKSSPATSTRCSRTWTADGAAADLRARRIAGSAWPQAGGRHRPRHHQLAGRDGAQRHPRRASGRGRPPAAAVDRPLRGDRRRRRLRRAGDAGERPAEHDRLGEAADGPRPRRPSRCPAVSLPLHRRARNGQARDARRREEPGRGVGGDPADAARACRGEPRRRARRRGRHRARVLRRRAAAGDQGRGDAGGPQRAAPAERADRGGDRLRSRQRVAGDLRDLRPRRRHVRHLDPEAVARRVRGARDQRRLRARRRRLRPSRLLLDHRGGRAAAAFAGGHAAADGEGARSEGEPDDPHVRAHRRDAVRREQGRV